MTSHGTGRVRHRRLGQQQAERLVAADLLHPGRHVVVVHHVLQFLLGGRAGRLRLADDQVGQLVLLHPDLVGVGDRVQQDLRPQALLGPGVDQRPELLGGALEHPPAAEREQRIADEGEAGRGQVVGPHPANEYSLSSPLILIWVFISNFIRR